MHFTLGVNTKMMAATDSLAKQGWPQCLQKSENLADWQNAADAIAPGERVTARRHVFNRFLQEYCARNPKFVFVDVDALIKPEHFLDPKPNQENPLPLPDHFRRSGYIAIADNILGYLREPEAEFAVSDVLPQQRFQPFDDEMLAPAGE